jgi:hypothetical protein
MEKAGCPVGDRFFSAMDCEQHAGGGFMPDGDGVSLMIICLCYLV